MRAAAVKCYSSEVVTGRGQQAGRQAVNTE